MRHQVGPGKIVRERCAAVLPSMLCKGVALSYQHHAECIDWITHVVAVRTTRERIRVAGKLGRQAMKGDLN